MRMTKEGFINGLRNRAELNEANRGGVKPRKHKQRPLKDLTPDPNELKIVEDDV